jgi:hypothetical protein
LLLNSFFVIQEKKSVKVNESVCGEGIGGGGKGSITLDDGKTNEIMSRETTLLTF